MKNNRLTSCLDTEEVDRHTVTRVTVWLLRAIDERRCLVMIQLRRTVVVQVEKPTDKVFLGLIEETLRVSHLQWVGVWFSDVGAVGDLHHFPLHRRAEHFLFRGQVDHVRFSVWRGWLIVDFDDLDLRHLTQVHNCHRHTEPSYHWTNYPRLTGARSYIPADQVPSAACFSWSLLWVVCKTKSTFRGRSCSSWS